MNDVMRVATFSRFFLVVVGGPLLGTEVATRGDVYIVDATGGGDFTDVQPALDAATTGDTLLVRGGDYGGLDLTGKSLEVSADAGADVHLRGQVVVDSLGVEQWFVLRRLAVEAPLSHDALHASDCAGLVWIEDCELRGGVFSFLALDTSHGASLEQCSSVVLERCALFAGEGPFGGDGLHAVGSAVQLHDCELMGRTDSEEGGAGAYVEDGFIFAARSVFRGGKGSDSVIFSCTGKDGGDGLVLGPGVPAVHALDCVLEAGPGGLDPLGCGGPGMDGSELVVQSGTYDELPGVARSFQVTSPIREETAATIELAGEPGDLVWLGISLEAAPLFVTAFQGALLPAAPLGLVFVGAAGSDGTLAVHPPLGALPAGVASFRLYLQAGGVDASGATWLSGGSILTIVDAAY